MTPSRIVSSVTHWGQQMCSHLVHTGGTPPRPSLTQLASDPKALPRWVRRSPVAMRYIQFLGLLEWEQVPDRAFAHQPPLEPLPYAPFLAACLVKIDQHMHSMAQLRRYLVEHPALTWALGFPHVPTPRHFTRMLRTIPNSILQGLLDTTVRYAKRDSPCR